VHVDHLGHLAQGERLEVLHALVEEVALPVDDEVHHLEHRLPALLDRLDHPVGRVQLVGDELLVLAHELLLVLGDVAVGARQLQPRQARVVEEDEVLALDLLHDQVGDDVVVAAAGVLEPRLGIELRHLVRRVLHVARGDGELLRDLAPAVVDELLEVVVDDAEGERALQAAPDLVERRLSLPRLPHQPLHHRVAELKEDALAEVARGDPGRVEGLDHPQHPLGLVVRVRADLVPLAAVADEVVERGDDLVDPARQVPFVRDVADDLLAQEELALGEALQGELFLEVVAQVLGVHGHRLVVLPLLVLLAAAAGLEAVEEDLLPVDLVVFLLAVLFLRLLHALLDVAFHEVEEGVVEQLLLEVLLEVEERHVQEIHRLVEARVDLHLLLERRSLIETGLHTASSC
jgi:hypothetical protein